MTVHSFLERELSVAGFLRRASEVTIEGDASGWVVRGTSDRRWTYAGGNASRLLQKSDTHFAAFPLTLADGVIAARTVRWRRDAISFELPATVALPPGPFEAIPLTEADAATIDEHWEHRDEVSLAYVKACLSRDPALGVRLDGRLVGWELVHDDGALGAAFVLPAFRRRGVMKSLQLAMVTAQRRRGAPIFKHVALDNDAWLPAQEPSGWRALGQRCWFEVEP